MCEITKHLDIVDIFKIKIELLDKIKKLETLEDDIYRTVGLIHGYAPFRIDYRFDNYDKNRDVKYIDRICWDYLVKIFNLHKYMLCTDFIKLQKEISEFATPEFTIENATAWIDSLKNLIYDNVKTLIKQVFEKITNGSYLTGSGYNAARKKRNNNGVDKIFILRTYDYSHVFGYVYDRPTLTDDLEKVCYLLSGKTIPDNTCKEIMRNEKKSEFSNEFFKIKIYLNGNTHYWLNDDIRQKLNYFGAGKGIIGEDIKIKIFNDK